MGKDGVILKNHADIPLVGGNLVNDGITHVNMARILLIKPGYGSKKSGFPASAGPQEGKKLTFRHIDFHVVQGNHAGKGFSDLFYVNTFSDHGPVLCNL